MALARRACAGTSLGLALLLAACGDPAPPSAPPEPLPTSVDSWAEPLGTGKHEASGLPLRVRRRTDGAEMVFVRACRFRMGASDRDGAAGIAERPAHEVVLSRPYYIDVHEVTQGRWRRYVAAGGARGAEPPQGADDLPRCFVNWKEARAYCAWAGVELPTEAQWEYAARGGVAGAIYPWGDRDDPRRRNGPGAEDGFADRAPVGSFPPNAYGLFDVSGNVEELCLDEFAFYETASRTDPGGPARESGVVRGGFHASHPQNLRIASRDPIHIGSWGPPTGFRCVRNL